MGRPRLDNGEIKKCPQCGFFKPLSEYHIRDSERHWFSTRCKQCHNGRGREYRQTEQYRDTHAKWQQSENGQKVVSKRMEHWRKKNPLKRKAHHAVSHALRDGRLEKLPCKVCGLKAEAHHHDYSKPLDVVWLCKSHHVELHYDENTKAAHF